MRNSTSSHLSNKSKKPKVSAATNPAKTLSQSQQRSLQSPQSPPITKLPQHGQNQKLKRDENEEGEEDEEEEVEDISEYESDSEVGYPNSHPQIILTSQKDASEDDEEGAEEVVVVEDLDDSFEGRSPNSSNSVDGWSDEEVRKKKRGWSLYLSQPFFRLLFVNIWLNFHSLISLSSIQQGRSSKLPKHFTFSPPTKPDGRFISKAIISCTLSRSLLFLSHSSLLCSQLLLSLSSSSLCLFLFLPRCCS